MATAPTPPTAAPTAPDRADRATFSSRATAWADYQKVNLVPEMTALATNAYTNALDAATQAGAAQASATASDASATLSAGMAAAAGATAWVSGTTYAIGNVRYSLVDFQSYRRKTAGAGTTDPSLDITNWAKVTFGVGFGGQTTTGSVTLTASSAAAITVTPATPGLYATLPDATTCTKADNLFAIYNDGDFDYGVKDSAGTQLGWVRARTGAMIGLADSSTAAGVWAYYGLEKTGITASYVNSTLTNMGSTIRRIALDSNRTCFLFGGTDCYAIVYDASTQTWGSATLVRSGLNGFLGVLSSTNQVLVASHAATTSLFTATLNISGVAVTVNANVTTTLGSALNQFSQLIAVGSSFVLGYLRSSAAGIRAITVSGTVPTIGAESATTPATVLPMLFAAGSVVRTLSVATGASQAVCAPFTVSGSTLTAGTSASVTTGASNFRAFLNGNGNIVCHYINATHVATIFKLTGTVEAASSVSLGTAPSTLVIDYSDYVSVTASKTAFTYHAGSTSWYANILTDTGGTASAGTEISQAVYGNLSLVSGLTSSGNTARFAAATSSDNGIIRHISLDCSGTSPTVSRVQQIAYYRAGLLGANNSTPQASDTYGVRQPKTLIAGSRVHLLGNSVSWDMSFTSAGIQYNKPVPFFDVTSNVRGVVGAANSESFIANSLDNGSTGFVINRIEAAA